jgi:hypothetical protein
MAFDVPVVLIVFQRPDTTARVLDAVRKVQPSRLFVIADGPRTGRPAEEKRCRQVRALFEDMGWDCTVYRNFAEENQGLKLRVVSGLDWVFDHVDRAIILEDDCVPDPVFFPFCDTLLDRYASISNVFTISGNNFQPEWRTDASYYFSRYMHCWGWATWKTAWEKMDPAMSSWPEVRRQGWLQQLFATPSAAAYWHDIFERVFNSEIDSWAYVWQYCIWMYGGINVLPEVNLVRNVGHGDLATHTKEDHSAPVRHGDALSQPFKHPPCVLRHRVADDYTQTHHYERSRLRRFVTRARNHLRHLL